MRLHERLSTNACMIWDLDQTLANCRHRLHWLLDNPTKPNWKEFNARTADDKPIMSAVLIYNALLSQGLIPYICTSRYESARAMTLAWLHVHTIPLLHSDHMLMRDQRDARPSHLVKRSMVEQIRKAGMTPLIAFEDQPTCVGMYRSLGIDCFAADDTSWRNGTFKEAAPADALAP